MSGAVSFYRKKVTMRIYSPAITSTGGSDGVAYLEVRFQSGNIGFGLGPALAPETLILDRLTFNADAHYVVVDDAPILAPIPLTFEVRGTDKYINNVLAALSDPFGTTASSSAWTVGNKFWTGYATSAVTRRNSDNTSITIPTFAVSGKKLVRVELKMDKTSTDADAVDQVFKFTGVHFPREQISGSLQDDGLPFSVNGAVYGDVTRSSTGFSTGSQTDT